jgi:hypothetical protein
MRRDYATMAGWLGRGERSGRTTTTDDEEDDD